MAQTALGHVQGNPLPWEASEDPQGRFWEISVAANGVVIHRYGPDHKIISSDKGISVKFRFDPQANEEVKKLGAIWLKDGRWFFRKRLGLHATDLSDIVGSAYDRWQAKWTRPVKQSARSEV